MSERRTILLIALASGQPWRLAIQLPRRRPRTLQTSTSARGCAWAARCLQRGFPRPRPSYLPFQLRAGFPCAHTGARRRLVWNIRLYASVTAPRETHKSKEVNDETHSDRCRESGHFGSRSLDDRGECPTNVSGPRSVSSLCPLTNGPDTTLCPTSCPSLCSSRACPDRCQCSRRCCSRWGQLPL